MKRAPNEPDENAGLEGAITLLQPPLSKTPPAKLFAHGHGEHSHNRKKSEPGKNPESEGKTTQCLGSEPPRRIFTTSSSRNRNIGPNSAIPYQPIPTRQIRTWCRTERVPPPPGKSPATKSADSVGV